MLQNEVDVTHSAILARFLCMYFLFLVSCSLYLFPLLSAQCFHIEACLNIKTPTQTTLARKFTHCTHIFLYEEAQCVCPC
mmetsp:Transcript_72020/g.105555  ORF Transcript_72020/g.105555 Transcript_72020/m.105555 type:complete len:80 (+) Transcript_72020:267-506(+)